MGQYYKAYTKHFGNKPKVFDNKVDGDWNGLTLMEHSYYYNSYVGNVVNDLFYNKGKVCWVGDYYDENDYAQVNCDKEIVKKIGKDTWDNDDLYLVDSHKCNVRYLNNCLIVNHTKKLIIVCDKYYKANVYKRYGIEEWDECIHPLPLLTCSANHSGGSYYGINQHLCGTWFNDEIEVVLLWDINNLIDQGYQIVEYIFRE